MIRISSDHQTSGQAYRGSCDGVSRRGFLRIGALGFGGAALTLADLLRASPAPSKRHKSVIQIFLAGGPPHQDLWDLKREAPREIRGEFRPIETNVSGIEICEVFPKIAKLMDRCAVIRSVVGAAGGHDAWQCLTGWPPRELAFLGGRPSIGSVANKLLGPVDPSVPTFIGLTKPTRHVPWSDPGPAGFLGPEFSSFRPDGPAMADMRLSGVSVERLDDRRRLLASVDRMRRDIDTSGVLDAADTFTKQAFHVLTSHHLVEALDLSREPEHVRERYGDGKPFRYQYDGAPTVNQQLLLARRLVDESRIEVIDPAIRWRSSP